jgi:RNA polymerase sigma factor (sigma-70 family)
MLEGLPVRDRTPLSEAQRELAARYLPMARKVAKAFKTSWPHLRDEFESAACWALVEAAEAFDPGRGVKFATFARCRVWGAMKDVQRKQSLFGRGADVPQPGLHRISGYVEEYGAVLNATPDDPIDLAAEAVDEVERWLGKLPRPHAATCRLIYLHGMTQPQAAAALGCTPSRVGMMHRQALAMLNGTWIDVPKRRRGRPGKEHASCSSCSGRKASGSTSSTSRGT